MRGETWTNTEERLQAKMVWRFSDLVELGIATIRTQMAKMVERGEFPRPFYLSERIPIWRRETIENWLAERERRSQEGRC